MSFPVDIYKWGLIRNTQVDVNPDDFADFVTACNTAVATGRSVRLPGRVLTIPANTVIPGGVNLRGVRGQTYLSIIGTGDLRAGGNRISLKDIGISGGTYGFNTNGFNKHSIETCGFDSQANHCVYIDSDNNEIDRNSFTNGSASAVALVGATAYHNEVTRNSVTNCANFGVWLSSGANRNLVRGNKTLQNGLELVGAGYDCWENRIHHNHAQGTGDNGISVTGYRNSVMGNICSLNANHGIGLYGERNECIGNTGRNNGQRNAGAPGSGNYAGVTCTPAFGGLGRKNIIVGNRFDDDQGAPTQYSAVKLEVNSYALWGAGQTVTNANLYRYNGLNIYRAAAPGTTGATPPTHVAGSVSDGSVTWTFIEEFPSNIDAYDNEVIGNRGGGNIQAAMVIDNTSNKHSIVMPGLFRIPSSGRNQYADILNGNGTPEGVVTARPGSTYARQDVSAQGIAFWTKQSGTGNTGWLRTTSQDSGTTAQRPSMASYGAGVRSYCYFDTTLGKPIWWSGSAWVDATGTGV